MARPGPLWVRGWAALSLTPVVIWLLASSRPWWGQMLVVGFVFAALLVEERRTSVTAAAA